MLRTKTLQAAFVLPATVALAIASLAGQAKADQAADAALKARLQEFANQTSATNVGTVKDTDKAAATDVVYALYSLLQDPNSAFTTDAQVANLVMSALDATPKLRADRNKLVTRIVDAAILGSSAQNNPARVSAILTGVLSSSSGLSAAGKAAAVAQALKSAPSAGAQIATASNTNTVALATAVLKVLKTNQAATPEFIDSVLDLAGGDHGANALAIIKAIKTLPLAVGDVAAGRALDITNGVPTALSDGTVITFVKAAIATPGVKGIGEIVAGGLSQVSAATNIGNTAGDIAAASIPSNKGLVASGALRALTATGNLETPSSILTKVAAAKTALKASEYTLFATNAALSNSAFGADIAIFAIGNSAANAANATKIGVGVIKSISYTNPRAAEDVGLALANNALFSATRSVLAANLAKGVTNNYLGAGAAVAGVVDAETGSATAIAAAAIKAAPKAGAAIAEEVSSITSVGGGDNGLTFAKALSVAVNSATNAGSVAAGVSMAYIQNAGVITAGVITSSSATIQKSALKIAGTAANFVDVEGISQIGASVGALLQSVPALAKSSSFGTLATTLTKAINKKSLPVVAGRQEFNWTNRLDEVGELASVLVTAAINSSITGHDTAATFASIGSSIYKSVSQKLLANVGNNLIDLKDVAGVVAGAIFQTIKNSTLTAQQKTDLLTPSTGALVVALEKASKTSFNKGLVDAALSAVNGNTGTFATGSMYDPETPVKNL